MGKLFIYLFINIFNSRVAVISTGSDLKKFD